MIHERPRQFAARIASRALSLGLLLCLASDCDRVFSAFITLDPLPPNMLSPPAPDLISVSPDHGSSAGGLTLRLTGTNLAVGATFSIAGKPAAGTCDENGLSCTVDVPANPRTVGLVPVVVTNPDGLFSKKDDLFTYVLSDIAFSGVPITVDLNPRAVAVGAFNYDGNRDLVVGSSALFRASVLLGNGKADTTDSFKIPTAFSDPIPTYGSPQAVVVGDFNGDTKLDIAVASNRLDPPKNGTVLVLLGNGLGGFAALPPVPSDDMYPEPAPSALAIFYASGSSIPNLVVANSNTGSVRVLEGKGTGLFTSGARYAGLVKPCSLAVGDFNGDTVDDIAVVDEGKPDLILLHQTGVARIFTPSTRTIGAAVSPSAVVAGAIRYANLSKSDPGLSGVAITNSLQGTVSVLLSRDNQLEPFNPTVVPKTGTTPVAVALGDFNGDKVPDLAVLNYGNNSVSVLLGDGTGNFAPPTSATKSWSVGRSPQAFAVGDFDGDTLDDLAVADTSDSTVTILLNTSQ